METTRLGNSELVVSRLGLGGCPLGGHGWGLVNDDDSVRAVRTALDLGINFFDTADVYGLGHSERILSRALGSNRHDVIVATKFGVKWDSRKNISRDISPRYLRLALEASLRRLKLEFIPLYYVHWPDGRTSVEAAIEELERCRAKGKIQAIGVSNFSAEQIRIASQVTQITCVQAQLSLLNRKALALSQVVREAQASLVTWGSLAQGLLTGKYSRDSHFDESDRRSRYENFQGEVFSRNLNAVEIAKQISKRLGKSPSQIAIRWLLDTSQVDCVLFGAKTSRQVQENVGASGWSLSDTEYAELANSQVSSLVAS